MSARKVLAAWSAVGVLAVAGCGGSGGKAPGARPVVTHGGPARPHGGASREVSPGVVRASSGPVTATMHAPGHRPRVNGAWPISFTVLERGRPIRAEVRYQFLFAGQVVARRSHYRFTGRFHDIFRWPASAMGYPLTFRATISAGGAALDLDYPVQVRR